MTDKIVLENAYVLHARPYRETSLLLDFFTETYGRVSAIAKCARTPKSTKKSLLQPFRFISISTIGRSDLKTLTSVELIETSEHLTGDRLFSAMYLNELLYHALPKDDPHPKLFECYRGIIKAFEDTSVLIEPTLRQFEMLLLTELGYAISLNQDAETNETICADSYYIFNPAQGFTKTLSPEKKPNPFTFLGSHLLSFNKNELSEQAVLKSAKRLMRLALSELLGSKAINSKKLFAVNMES